MVNQKARSRHEVIAKDIIQAWKVLAKFRMEKGFWANMGEAGTPDESTGGAVPGRVLICEALELFLIPALNPFLKEDFDRILRFTFNEETFLDVFANDLQILIDAVFVIHGDNTIETRFFSDPYSMLDDIKAQSAVPQNVDCATYVVSVLLHVWYLFGSDGGLDEELCRRLREKVSFDSFPRLVDACIEFIIECHEPGKGWRWTNNEKVPSTLYFSWTVCEILNEVDNLILDSERRPNLPLTADPLDQSSWNQDLIDKSPFLFNREALAASMRDLRSWALEQLRDVSVGTMVTESVLMDPSGQNNPQFVCFPSEEYTKLGLDDQHSQSVLWLNNLFVMEIVLLTYGDRTGDSAHVTAMLENGLLSLIKKYLYDEDLRNVLDHYNYMFYLPPGDGEVLDLSKLRNNRPHSLYRDKIFQGLLMRLLVLYIRYDIGNFLLLEEHLKTLYRRLLEARNHTVDYQYAWDSDAFSVFATVRAMESLKEYSLLEYEEGSVRPTTIQTRTELDDVLDDFAGRLGVALRDITTQNSGLQEGTGDRIAAIEGRLQDLKNSIGDGSGEGVSKVDWLQDHDGILKLQADVNSLRAAMVGLKPLTDSVTMLENKLKDIEVRIIPNNG